MKSDRIKSKSLMLLAMAAILSFGSDSIFAHHNWAAHYDVEGDIEIEGFISDIAWRNPHVRISFTVNQGTADEMVYTTESNSVASLTRMGVTKELLSNGTAVKVAGYPSKTQDDDLFMNHMLLPDGREIIFARTAEPRWPDAQRIGNTDIAHGRVTEEDFSKRPTTIFAVWSTIFGAEGSHRAMKFPEGKISIDYAEQRGTDNCVTKHLWQQMGAPYPIQLIDKGDTVIIHAEEHDTIRTVYMDVPHVDQGEAGDNLGYSTGRRIGESLLVKTTFVGSGSAVELHEIYTLSADHSRLHYTQNLIDPAADNTSIINHKWWEYIPGSFVQAYDCV